MKKNITGTEMSSATENSVRVVRWARKGKGAMDLAEGESKSAMNNYAGKISFAGIIWSSHIPEDKTDEDFINSTIWQLSSQNSSQNTKIDHWIKYGTR